MLNLVILKPIQMKSNKEVQAKINEIKKRIASTKKLNNKTDTTNNEVGFVWYMGNVISIEQMRLEIKLLKWVLK
jgi:hypothetical protein